MLSEIMSDEYVSNGNKRGRIKLHPGLNTVLGGKQSDNSIGKSTFLLAIDFCFGGDAYCTATDLQTRFSNVRHTVKFAFDFDGRMEYYSRGIVTPTEVNKCDSDYNVLETIGIKEFREHLFQQYRIDLPSITFRDVVGRYMRIYGKDNYSEKRPLEAASKEKESNGITALEKLFNYYSQIEEYKIEAKKKEDRKKTFNAAKKENLLQVYVPTAAQVKKNEKEIADLQKQLDELTATSDVDMSEEEMVNADEVLAIKSRITSLKRKRSKLISQQNTVKLNDAGTPISEEDYRELQEFFPGVDLKRLSDVENFHRKLQGILKEEIDDEVQSLQTLIDAVSSEIEELQEQQRNLGVPASLPSKFIKKHEELTRRIASLNAQNKAKASADRLKDEVKQANDTLHDAELQVLNTISGKINEQMRQYNEYVYSGTRNAPVIQFDSGSKYTFHTPGDGGLGTGYKSLILFDLSVLRLTQLPVAAHDSLMFNHIGYEPLEKIMELYIQSGKQIFIAYDKQNAPTPCIQEILNQTTVIHLSEDGNELFGYSWAKKTDREGDEE